MVKPLTIRSYFSLDHDNTFIEEKSSKDVHDFNTRRKMHKRLPLAKRNWGKQKFFNSGFRDWNTLDPSIRDVTPLSIFRTQARNAILK